MSRTTKFCSDCEQNNNPPKCPGFLVGWEDTPINECPFCKNKDLITYDISDDDILLLGNISTDKHFLESMINLKEKDPIEYQLKISQFKANLSKVRAEQQSSNQVHCSYCHSTNTEKITSTSKVVNTAVWGIFGTKRHKNYHCNDCKSDF